VPQVIVVVDDQAELLRSACGALDPGRGRVGVVRAVEVVGLDVVLLGVGFVIVNGFGLSVGISRLR